MTPAIRALKLAGAELLFLTNAAGSLRPEVGPGRLVAITDHINFLPGTPMIGPNDERFGPRFFSMANAYDADERARLNGGCGRARHRARRGRLPRLSVARVSRPRPRSA